MNIVTEKPRSKVVMVNGKSRVNPSPCREGSYSVHVQAHGAHVRLEMTLAEIKFIYDEAKRFELPFPEAPENKE